MTESVITLGVAQRDFDKAESDARAAQAEVIELETALGVAREKAHKCFQILVDVERRLEVAKAGGESVTPVGCTRDHAKLRTPFCTQCGAPKGAVDV